jgi:hypothetical protein
VRARIIPTDPFEEERMKKDTPVVLEPVYDDAIAKANVCSGARC